MEVIVIGTGMSKSAMVLAIADVVMRENIILIDHQIELDTVPFRNYLEALPILTQPSLLIRNMGYWRHSSLNSCNTRYNNQLDHLMWGGDNEYIKKKYLNWLYKPINRGYKAVLNLKRVFTHNRSNRVGLHNLRLQKL